MVDIVSGTAKALDVATDGGLLTTINVIGPRSGGDSWATKATFWADVLAATKECGGHMACVDLGVTSISGSSPLVSPPLGAS